MFKERIYPVNLGLDENLVRLARLRNARANLKEGLIFSLYPQNASVFGKKILFVGDKLKK